MLDTLRDWLNGKRDYFIGVAIFEKLSDNTPLLNLLQNGPTPFNKNRLLEELRAICKVLKEDAPAAPPAAPTHKTFINTKKPLAEAVAKEIEPVNPVLYQTCKQEADKLYKETMNLRAELFALANVNDFEDPNTQALVQSRSSLAIKVVDMFNRASRLYDQADFVKLHGRLPTDDPDEAPAQENEYENLPDHLVKQTLDNLRKNYNKMKKRPETPHRVQLLQKHEANIKILENKWLLLKPR